MDVGCILDQRLRSRLTLGQDCAAQELFGAKGKRELRGVCQA